MNCPICGSKVRYVGLTSVECAGEWAVAKHREHCPNYPFMRYAHKIAPGSLQWARVVMLLYPDTRFTAVLDYEDGVSERSQAWPDGMLATLFEPDSWEVA